jgi:fatty acid omega-hydroxylase
MNNFANEVIAQRRRDSENTDKLGPDLLSRFMDCKDPKDIPSSKELRDIVMNFLIAGRDTTACALSWTMYELARHPEVRAKVIAECNNVCAPPDEAGGTRSRTFSDADYSYDKIGELRYTHAVAMEVLRLHPSVPVEVKFAIKKDTLPDGTPIHPGGTCIYSPYAMGRSKKLWGDDAEMFKPERMMDEDGKNVEPGQFKYTTFNAGPRLCLGKGLALMEIKLALAILLQRFDFEIDNNHQGGYESTLVLPMKPGLVMKVKAKK